MMKEILLFLFWLQILVSVEVSGQTFEWSAQNQYTGLTRGISICNDNALNTYVAGPYYQAGNHSQNYPWGSFLNKYNSAGQLQWTNYLPKVGAYYLQIAINQNAIYATGSDSIGYFVSEYNLNGNLIQKINLLPVINGGTINRIYDVGTDAFNNYYIAGIFAQNISFGNIQLTIAGSTQKMFIAKFDSQNNCIWAKASSTGIVLDHMQIDVDALGNSYVGGSYTGSMSINNVSLAAMGTSENGFVSKFDNAGNVQWLFAIRSQGCCQQFVNSVSCDPWGNVYALGYYDAPITLCNTAMNPSYSNIFLLKLNNNGSAIWARQIGGPYFDEPGGVDARSGNVYISGQFQVTAQIGHLTLNSINTASNMYSEPFVAKFDLHGVAQWAVTTGCSINSSGEAAGISTDVSENVFVTGMAEGAMDFGGNPQPGGGPSMFLAKINNGGNVGIKVNAGQNNIRIYPNPVSKQFTIETIEPSELTITTALGQVIFQQQLITGESKINLQDQNKGMYFITINTGNAVETKKIVVE